MNMETIRNYILEFLENDAANRVPEELAKKPEYAGRRIYDGMLIGAADAGDGILASLSANKEANIDMMQPEEWLPGARTVLSFFLSFAAWIKEENIVGDWPSDGWLHGRIEGQAAVNKVTLALADLIRGEGYEAVAPSLDQRFRVISDENGTGVAGEIYTSNWSERHVAFAAGLGTFGLSRGIITELGMAGRLTSIITTFYSEPGPRPYSDLLDNCIKCGGCAERCPVGAITVPNFKDHLLCDLYLKAIRKKEDPYYGCGKCQCGVPCAYGIPT